MLKPKIVIPTYNRPENLDRIQRYYSHMNFEQNIVIVDGSKNIWKGYKNSGFKYIHAPGESWPNRLKIGFEQTLPHNIVSLSADDDFIIPKAWDLFSEFLIKNEDYSAISGRFLRVVKKGKKILKVSEKYPGFDSIDYSDVQKRLIKAFNPYQSLLYIVHRKENWDDLLKCEITHKNLCAMENLIAFITALNGKIKRLPIFYYTREMENQKHGIPPRGFINAAEDYIVFDKRAKELTDKDNYHIIDRLTNIKFEYRARYVLQKKHYIYKRSGNESIVLIKQLLKNFKHNIFKKRINNFSYNSQSEIDSWKIISNILEEKNL